MKYTNIKKSTKKLTEKSTKKSLEFKSNNSIKTKCLKYIVKKMLPTL